VQRRGNGPRGSQERLFLAMQEKSLHFVDVEDAGPGQREQHQRHEGELRTQSKARPRRRLQTFHRYPMP